MHLPDYLSRDAAGYVHFAGHRIGLTDVVHFYNQGESAESLHARFPTVPLAQLHMVIAFYLENQLDVNTYCETSAKEIAARREASAGRGPSHDELRRRREERRLAAGA